MTRRATASVAVALATVIVTMLGGCGQAAKDPSASTKAAAQAPPSEVTVAAFQSRLLPEYLEVTGRIEAVRAVDVRCRITGYLTKIFFRDGQFVKAGDPLYEIDPRPYGAQLESAKGSLEKLFGERRFAEVQVARYEKLSAKGAASVQEFDTWKAKVEFCTVTSPIDGQIGRTQLQVGNLINQDSTTLATVVSIDPIHVYFNVDEPTFVRVVRTMRGESEPAMVDRRQFVVDIGLVDDRERHYPYRCVVDFLNNQVDPQTATITVRGVLENPHDPDPAHPRPPLFRSGMFIRARLPLGEPAALTLVPEAAIGSNQDRKVLWLVGVDGTSHSREVLPGQKVGAWIAVRSADPARPLDASDRVVVRGLQRCREGKPVTVVMAPADTIGLDTLPAASAAAPAPLPQAAPATEATGVLTAPAQGAVETLPRPAGVTASPEPSGPKPP